MKKFLKLIQTACLVAIVYMAGSTLTAIISAVLCMVLGACAYAEGLFHD